MQDPSKLTATVAAASLVTKGHINAQATGAASLLIMVPMLVVFLIAQRAIVRGFAAGVGK
jgi:ABC-type glycerol-3-phosphate transport system permease component